MTLAPNNPRWRPIAFKAAGWCLGVIAALASIPILFFALGVIHVDRVNIIVMWSLAALNVAAAVFSLRVAFPWPAQRSERAIQRSAKKAVALDGLAAAIFIPWALFTLASRGLNDANAQILLLMAIIPLLLLAPVLWHFGLAALQFRKIATPEMEAQKPGIDISEES